MTIDQNILLFDPLEISTYYFDSLKQKDKYEFLVLSIRNNKYDLVSYITSNIQLNDNDIYLLYNAIMIDKSYDDRLQIFEELYNFFDLSDEDVIDLLYNCATSDNIEVFNFLLNKTYVTSDSIDLIKLLNSAIQGQSYKIIVYAHTNGASYLECEMWSVVLFDVLDYMFQRSSEIIEHFCNLCFKEGNEEDIERFIRTYQPNEELINFNLRFVQSIEMYELLINLGYNKLDIKSMVDLHIYEGNDNLVMWFINNGYVDIYYVKYLVEKSKNTKLEYRVKLWIEALNEPEVVEEVDNVGD